MKVHELLAVDSQLKGQATATRTDLLATLKNKRHHFEEKRRDFQSNEEGTPIVTEEQSDLQTTAIGELTWLAGILTKQIDVAYQVDEANTQARSDVILDDGTVLFKNAPATALLQLDHRLGEILEVVKAVPTLDPAKAFAPDQQRGKHVFKAREVRKARTKKTQRPIVLYDATPNHPAQTQLISEDVVIGHVVENEWSGLLTVSQKGDMIERVEHLRRAVKKARMRANDFDLKDEVKIGAAIFAFVIDGTKPNGQS